MATLVREYILHNDDSIDMGRWQKLMNTVGLGSVSAIKRVRRLVGDR
jgi:hypothetical protein